MDRAEWFGGRLRHPAGASSLATCLLTPLKALAMPSVQSYSNLRFICSCLSGIPYTPGEVSARARLERLEGFPLTYLPVSSVDRKSGVTGKRVSVRVDPGVRLTLKQKNKTKY